MSDQSTASPPAGPAGDTSSAGPEGGGAIVTVPPSPPPQLVGQPSAGDGESSLYLPIAAALIGAFVAQGLAARVNYQLRSRTEQVDAFDRAFTTGMAARQAMAHYRQIVNQSVPQWPANYELVAAVTEFRAAELHYRAQFGDDDARVDAALAAALTAVGKWATPELSDAELEERQEEEHQKLWEEGQARYPDYDHDYELRETLRVDGRQLEEQLNAAITAFGDATRRSRRRLLPWL